MTQAGLASRVDSVGNVIGRYGSADDGVILCGSHIDTVPDGGWLDGSYGVLAGLECVRALRDARCKPRRAVEIAAFVDEEGAYLSLLGSRATVGDLTRDDVMAATDGQGKPLWEAMREVGLDAQCFAESKRDRDQICAYVELHIEQGPVLEERKIDVGIVQGIVGIMVVEHTFTGSADHAGTTPIEMRRDALRCAAEFIAAAYARLPEASPGRFAFGAIEALPGASNVVPHTARLVQEIRAIEEGTIRKLFSASSALAEEAATRLGVDHNLRQISFNAPAQMAPRVMDLVKASCAEASVSHLCMPSGAGHDAQSFAGWCPTGMIFVPSRRGASHRPDESTDERDLAIGADILLRTLEKLVA